jgi:hypothetical protein
MKLTESKLRSIIREELSDMDFGGEKYLNEFQQYLSSVGRQKSDTEFEYKGYTINLDHGGFFLAVNIRRDRTDKRPAATARIEDDAVRYKKEGKGRPEISNSMYRSPNQVISKLMKAVEM